MLLEALQVGSATGAAKEVKGLVQHRYYLTFEKKYILYLFEASFM